MTPISLRRPADILVAVVAAVLGGAVAVAQTPPPTPAPAPAPSAQPQSQSATPSPSPTPVPKRKRTRQPAPADGNASPKGSEGSLLAPLAWLEGCWRGEANGREFREHWMPLRGGMMIGVSQTVLRNRTVDFEYLRVEPRADGVYYVILPPGKSESTFKLTEQPDAGAVEGKDEEFVFTNPALEFPKKITYRRGTEGWLYAVVAGSFKGADKEVTYPMRRIDCQSGELLLR